jgi:hypothetical protein
MTYGRGRMNDYILAVYNDGQWKLTGNDWYKERTSGYNNISGSIQHCINYIFERENLLEHPYQSMINSYRGKYRETQNSILEINTNGAIGFNGQAWISL